MTQKGCVFFESGKGQDLSHGFLYRPYFLAVFGPPAGPIDSYLGGPRPMYHQPRPVETSPVGIPINPPASTDIGAPS